MGNTWDNNEDRNSTGNTLVHRLEKWKLKHDYELECIKGSFIIFLVYVLVIGGITFGIIALMNYFNDLHLDAEGWFGWGLIIGPIVAFWFWKETR